MRMLPINQVSEADEIILMSLNIFNRFGDIFVKLRAERLCMVISTFGSDRWKGYLTASTSPSTSA